MAVAQQLVNVPNGLTNFSATIANLRARMAIGQKIYYSDIVNLINLYNSWRTHTHTPTDALWISYGNAVPGGYGNASEPRVTSSNTIAAVPATPLSDPGHVYMDESYQTQATVLINNIVTGEHTHGITDSYNHP